MSEMNCGLHAHGPQTCNLDLTSLYYFNWDHSIEINIILVSGLKIGQLALSGHVLCIGAMRLRIDTSNS